MECILKIEKNCWNRLDEYFSSIVLLHGKVLYVSDENIDHLFGHRIKPILKKYAIDENHELVHVDAYRLENSVFMELEEEITSNNIVFIEWSNFLLNQELLHEFFAIDIHYLSKNQRKFVFRAQGEKYQKILNQVIECINCI